MQILPALTALANGCPTPVLEVAGHIDEFPTDMVIRIPSFDNGFALVIGSTVVTKSVHSWLVVRDDGNTAVIHSDDPRQAAEEIWNFTCVDA